MPAMNDARTVAKQYASADGLQTRLLLHQKYSLNKQPYAEWIAQHYRIQPGMKVLELGCGTGVMWKEPERWLPEDALLLLTDFSDGMLNTARETVPERWNISFAQVDIQQIPYPDQHFDLVIANAMLYHVPDLDRAISEAARVLKPDGRFICATSGNNSIASWLVKVLGEGDARVLSFSLQNGEASLKKHFARIEMHQRQDALDVTDTDDLVRYVQSMASFAYVRNWRPGCLYALLDAQKKNGVIRIPKEYGLFQCYEPNVTKIFD